MSSKPTVNTYNIILANSLDDARWPIVKTIYARTPARAWELFTKYARKHGCITLRQDAPALWGYYARQDGNCLIMQ